MSFFSQRHYPKSWTLEIDASSTFGQANLITFRDPCVFVQLRNPSDQDIEVMLNGDHEAVFVLYADDVQVFGSELHITSVDFSPINGKGIVSVIVGMVK
jgi:hypothetical protein